MKSDWILEVLSDLKQFAQTNDLPILAEQLDDTAVVALLEITSKPEKKAQQTKEHETLKK